MTLNDVVKLPWIMREIGSGTRELLLNRLQEYKINYDSMSVLMEVGTIEAIKQGLLKVNAVSYLSRLAIEQELKNGQIDIVDLDDLNVKRQLWLVSPLKPYLTMPMKAFKKGLANL